MKAVTILTFCLILTATVGYPVPDDYWVVKCLRFCQTYMNGKERRSESMESYSDTHPTFVVFVSYQCSCPMRGAADEEVQVLSFVFLLIFRNICVHVSGRGSTSRFNISATAHGLPVDASSHDCAQCVHCRLLTIY